MMIKNKESLKLALANHLAQQNLTDYSFLLELINKDIYKLVLKCPTKEMFLGLTDIWKNRNKEEVLECLKEVIIEALEINGIEQTFTDHDWDKLAIIQVEHQPYNPRDNVWYTTELNTTKTYVGEFFEFD